MVADEDGDGSWPVPYKPPSSSQFLHLHSGVYDAYAPVFVVFCVVFCQSSDKKMHLKGAQFNFWHVGIPNKGVQEAAADQSGR